MKTIPLTCFTAEYFKILTIIEPLVVCCFTTLPLLYYPQKPVFQFATIHSSCSSYHNTVPVPAATIQFLFPHYLPPTLESSHSSQLSLQTSASARARAYHSTFHRRSRLCCYFSYCYYYYYYSCCYRTRGLISLSFSCRTTGRNRGSYV